jgi:hypothetical protein
VQLKDHPEGVERLENAFFPSDFHILGNNHPLKKHEKHVWNGISFRKLKLFLCLK